MTQARRIRRIIYGVSAVLALLMAGGAVRMVFAGTSSVAAWDCGTYRFSAKDWRPVEANFERRQGHDSPRQHQAHSLLACNRLYGRPKVTVRRLLGRPEPTLSTARDWYYELGPEPGPISVDGEFLQVTLRRGQVSRVRTITP